MKLEKFYLFIAILCAWVFGLHVVNASYARLVLAKATGRNSGTGVSNGCMLIGGYYEINPGSLE